MLISRRGITSTTNQCHQPAVVFDFEKDRAAFLIRWRGLHVGALPVAVEVLRNAVQPARISKVGINYYLLGRIVTKVFKPARGA
jgi:hypothetical protein